MRWRQSRRSQNVEDRRAQGGGRRMPVGKAGMGIGGILLALLAMFLSGNLDLGSLGGLLGGAGGGTGVQAGTNSTYKPSPADEKKKLFIEHVLGDTEETWSKIFRQSGKTYKKPKLVLFHGSTPTACGHGDAATGPFYCPADENIYLDMSFFQMLEKRFGAPGDFAQAYVIAHEVAHHIQNQLGFSEMVHRKRSQVSKAEYNRWSCALELQADFLAGVWAHHMQRTRGLLEEGDREEAINCAMRIGDDTLQRGAGRAVRPETFTHGSAKERAYWFNKGFTTGDFNKGDTFREMGLMR